MFTSVEHVIALCWVSTWSLDFYHYLISLLFVIVPTSGWFQWAAQDFWCWSPWVHFGTWKALQRDLRMHNWEAPLQQLTPTWVHRAGSLSVRWAAPPFGLGRWCLRCTGHTQAAAREEWQLQFVFTATEVLEWNPASSALCSCSSGGECLSESWRLHRATPPAQLMHLCPQDHCLLPVSFKVSDMPCNSVF